jgi:hypothetical protein
MASMMPVTMLAIQLAMPSKIQSKIVLTSENVQGRHDDDGSVGQFE